MTKKYAEIDTMELPKFNLEWIDIEALEAFRDKIQTDLSEMDEGDPMRGTLGSLWHFYNSAVNGYYLGLQLNAGIPLSECKVEKQ